LRLAITSLSHGGLRAYLGGLLGAWRLLPRMLEKRRTIQRRRRVSDDYIRRLPRESSRQATESQRRRIRGQLFLRFEL